MPNAGLINGRGRCGNKTPNPACDPKAELSKFSFKKGKRYRLRIINGSAFSAFTFMIDGHKLTVIEADMTAVQPHTVDRLNLNVAQRYSVIVEANQDVKNYWMKAVISTACYPEGTADDLEPLVLAHVNYEGADDKEPDNKETEHPTEEQACVDLDPTLLQPLKAQAPYPLSEVNDEKTIKLNIEFFADKDNINRGHINGITHRPEMQNPVLLRTIKGSSTFEPTENVYSLPSGNAVQFFITNKDEGEHPFHMHGHDFQIIASSKEKVDWDNSPVTYADVKKLPVVKNPIRRDTLTVPASGWVLIRFEINNPGIWAFHCHIGSVSVFTNIRMACTSWTDVAV